MSKELLEKLFQGEKNKKQTTWPGTDNEIYIRVATEKDLSDVITECDATYKERAGMWAYNAAYYDAEKANRILHKVVTFDPDGKDRIGTYDQFITKLTPEIRDVLEDLQTSFQDECSPDPDAMSEEDFEKLIEEVKKKPNEAVNVLCSIFVLRRLSIYLVNQVLSLQQANSSDSPE